MFYFYFYYYYYDIKGRNLFIFIFLNIIIIVVQVIGGIFLGSFLLLLDVFYNFSDVFFLIVSYIVNCYFKKKVFFDKIFGYKCVEIIVVFINVFLFIIVVLYLIYEVIV